MMILLRVLPLIIGEKIPSEPLHKKFLFLLIRISNIVFSPAIHKSDTTYLVASIAKHKSLHKHLLPDKKLLYKHHILIHHPGLICKIGSSSENAVYAF